MQGGERGAAEDRERGRRGQSPSVTPSGSPNSSSCEPLRRVGREREQRAEAEQAGDRDRGGGVRADALVARGERDQDRRDGDAAERADSSGALAMAASTRPGSSPCASDSAP